MSNKMGIVNELLSKKGRTPEEVKEELKKEKISVRPYHMAWVSSLAVATILWILPAVAKYTGWRLLSFFNNLPHVEFPGVILILGILFIILGISLESQACYKRKERGGLKDVDETIFIIKEGPYKVIRHPGYLAEIILFLSIPIAFSIWIPFTVLAIFAWCLVISMTLFLIKWEDRFNIRKWGEEYRQYMLEVPATNFVKGLKNISKAKH